ncbi:MAG: ABC transporter permease [Anditalea sp.]
MWKNHFKIAWRNILNQKLFSLINILGLSLGIMTVTFIFLYVMEEVSYDRFHAKAEQTYMIRHNYFMGDQDHDWHETAVPLAEMMRRQFPEVENLTSTTVPFGYSYRHKESLIDDVMTLHADADFFKVFDFKLLAGNSHKVLNEPNSIVISEKAAQKLFTGSDDALYGTALGEIITIDNEAYTITGIMETPASNSHLKFDAIISIHALLNDGYRKETWLPAGIVNYVVLKENAEPDMLAEKFKNIEKEYLWPQLKKHLGASMTKLENNREQYGYYLEPMLDIHLIREGNLKYIIIFSVSGLLLLALGFINYVNLFIASVNNRIKEVGIRKSLGAGKSELVKQFFMESALLCVIAFAGALVMVQLAMTPFNDFSGTVLNFDFFHNPVNSLYVLGLLMAVILLTSAYPAFYINSLKTVNSLKGVATQKAGKSKISIQKPFIVFQYAVSIGLIICFLVLYQQLLFMQQKDTGFNKENVLVMPGAYFFGENQAAFKQKLLAHSFIQSATFSYAIPSSAFDALSLYKKEGEDKEFQFYWMNADYDYLKTYDIEVVDGRGFSEDFPTDSSAVLLNEAAAEQIGKQDLIGAHLINHFDEKVKVIGVVKNFNFEHLKNEVKPLAIALSGENTSDLYASVKLNPGNPQQAIQDIRQSWKALNPGASFQYSFLDDRLNNLYKTEERTGRIIGLFTGLAVFISCFGLFGLITFTTGQRTKEIGVRKALGATVPEIAVLLSREFLLLVIIAFVIVVPVTYFMLNSWLQGFANRIDLGVDIFIFSGIIIFIISGLIMGFQTIRSASANPVDSLRSE